MRRVTLDGRRTELAHTVAVVGLGKVGLPLAVQYASKGARVIGCDINESVVTAVNEGQTPIKEEAFLAERLSDVHRRGLLTATTDTSAAVRDADVAVVIVPLMVDTDHEIDFRAIDSATREIGRGLHIGSLVVYETTLPVGTTRNRFGPILEEMSGLKMGRDFSVAFSPERIRTGRIFADLATYPKVVGGIDETSTTQGAAFYQAVLDAEVMTVSSTEAAELSKLMETTYRDVNIALANEFAKFAATRGINAREAIAAANSQPQSHVHEPGVGVGGHCIPVYPYFLINNADPSEMRLATAARSINDGMADHTTELLSERLGDLRGRHVVILGLAYRADVKEAAYSSAIRLMNSLEAEGAIVDIHDPLFSASEIATQGGRAIGLGDVGPVDAIIVQAFHSDYRDLPASFYQQARLVLDGRGDLNPVTLGIDPASYVCIGTPAVVREPISHAVEIEVEHPEPAGAPVMASAFA
jgi:nucleotide sugar dehydrogenase